MSVYHTPDTLKSEETPQNFSNDTKKIKILPSLDIEHSIYSYPTNKNGIFLHIPSMENLQIPKDKSLSHVPSGHHLLSRTPSACHSPAYSTRSISPTDFDERLNIDPQNILKKNRLKSLMLEDSGKLKISPLHSSFLHLQLHSSEDSLRSTPRTPVLPISKEGGGGDRELPLPPNEEETEDMIIKEAAAEDQQQQQNEHNKHHHHEEVIFLLTEEDTPTTTTITNK